MQIHFLAHDRELVSLTIPEQALLPRIGERVLLLDHLTDQDATTPWRVAMVRYVYSVLPRRKPDGPRYELISQTVCVELVPADA